MKTTFLLLSVSMVLSACSKKEIQPKPGLDYSQVKLKTSTHSLTSYSGTASSTSSDTTTYTYSGSAINYEVRRSTGSVNSYKLILNNGLYTQETYTGAVLSPVKSYYQLNAMGLVEKAWISNNGTTTQTSNYTYNTDKTRATENTEFSNYTNSSRLHYQNGIAAYALAERISHSPSIANASDSVVYEYYAALPFRADFYNTGLPASILGNPSKNLLKKTTYYDKLNNNAIRQTIEYAYETDNNGLITKKIFSLYTQPGNVMGLTDTTTFTHYTK